MYGDVENGDFSGGNVSMNSHTLSNHNGLISFINSNNSDYIDMNGYLNNVDVSFVIGLIKIHNLSQ